MPPPPDGRPVAAVGVAPRGVWSPPRLMPLNLGSGTRTTGAHTEPDKWEGGQPHEQAGPTYGYRMPGSGEPSPWPQN